jgi:hypothetical protein
VVCHGLRNGTNSRRFGALAQASAQEVYEACIEELKEVREPEAQKVRELLRSSHALEIMACRTYAVLKWPDMSDRGGCGRTWG